MHQVTKDGTCIFTDGNFSTNIYDMYIQEFNLGHDFGNRSLDNIEYIGPKTTDKTRTVYSDRLFQWDLKNTIVVVWQSGITTVNGFTTENQQTSKSFSACISTNQLR